MMNESVIYKTVILLCGFLTPIRLLKFLLLRFSIVVVSLVSSYFL